jgi:GH25 family lysozyme M1 (1,4-beta-N-acetylmuramidase)
MALALPEVRVATSRQDQPALDATGMIFEEEWVREFTVRRRSERQSQAAATSRVPRHPWPAVVVALVLSMLATAGIADAGIRSDATAAPAAAPANPNWLEGIDVSHWQNTIDWSQVAAAGKSFAIIKASEDTDYVDPMYATNRAAANAVGIRTTGYHFARPDATANDAVAEADHFIATVNLVPGDLVPALDLEVSGGLGTTALQNWVKAWLDEVTIRLGVRPMIYTSPSFWKNYLGDTSMFADAGYSILWIAHWTTNASPTVPGNNWGGHGWTFWQYSNQGSVPGITGRVDLDRYNGLDLAPLAYDPGFRLSVGAGTSAKQGARAAFTVTIKRTNFLDPVAFSVDGLPAGASATFGSSPTTGTSTSLTVSTSRTGTTTPTGSFPITITGTGGGLTRATTANLVVTDGLPPTLRSVTSSLYYRVALGSTTTPVHTKWLASDPSGIGSYRIQGQVNGGTWRAVTLSSPTSTSVNLQHRFGATYRYRMASTDRAGNASGWLYGRPTISSLHQQSSRSISYRGTWRTVTASSASGGSLKYATTRGASATFTFSGAAVSWVAAKGPTRGAAKIYVDGHYWALFSLYSSKSQSRRIVFSRTWASNGTHTLKIIVVGTSGHPRVDIDAFVRLRNL